MKLHLSLKTKVGIWILVGFLSPGMAWAQIESEKNDPYALVEVEVSQDYLASYKARRETHGIYYGVQYEPLVLSKYASTTQPGLKYKDLFGDEPIGLIRFNVDYKYNFALGSLAAGIDLATGSVSGSKSGSSMSLDVTKMGANFQFTLDMLMDEPYAAPYFGLNLWQMELSEKSPADSFSATTQMGYNYMLGVLVQLNWIDSEVAKDATFNFGLENTYLDLYITQYAKTESASDPNTETDFLYGAGIRLEF
ncbi:hypothetical protein [Bdellovibrio sp. HCB2-146]|uniref:hypothetical protein n=1 Tax=Bdellovibrio sp. HCB2-146 TaxID=3394362 RepID=UPI0039BD3C0A